MLELLALAALVLAAASALFLSVLVARRVFLASRKAERDAARERLLPLALDLVDGAAGAPALARADRQVFADTVRELSRRLRGDARARVGEHFAGSAELRHALAALSSRRAWRRAVAATMLGDMASTTAIPALRSALDDRDRDVRSAVVRSLGRLGDVESVPHLVRLLAADDVPRGIAAQALTELGAPALPALDELAVHPDAAVRAVAVRLLGLIGASDHAPIAEQALADPAAEVRAAAAATLARIGRPESARQLRRALGDRVGYVAAAAATALGELRDRGAGPMLAVLARGGDFDAGRAAAEALAAIDPEELRRSAAVPGAGAHLHEAADLLAL